MRLAALALHQFRNLASLRLEPAERLTVVVGENGQGKTNLVEAVYFLSTQKALRAAKGAELVAFGAPLAEVEGTVVEAVTTRLRLRVTAKGRTATVDGKRPRSLEAYADVLKVVAFTPDDLQVSKGPPAERRRWLDRAAFTRHAAYLAEHRAFSRALKARNRLLKDARRTGRLPLELEAFDEAVATTGARLWRRRLAVVDELAEPVAARFETIARLGRPLSMRYASEILDRLGEGGAAASETELSERLLGALAERRRVDVARGFTTAGPQADDVALCLDGREVRAFASQGQQRAVVLALKIAEIENLRARLGRTPLLLLDDVSSELDPGRNAHLLGYLAEFPGQALVTTTDPGLAPPAPEGSVRRLEMRAGRLEGEGVQALEISSRGEGLDG
jgi:DNA replication and repair protein RecF